jgi:hypothetical protein
MQDEITWVTALESEKFTNSKSELLAYELPISCILEDNSLKYDEMEDWHMINGRMMKYKKADVLKALKKNRSEHAKIVHEAQSGYRERAIELTKKLLDDLKAGKSVSLVINLPLPVNHLDEFDQVIRMLELSKGNEVDLDGNEFRCFMLNKWGWQHQFLASNVMYSETARNCAEG